MVVGKGIKHSRLRKALNVLQQPLDPAGIRNIVRVLTNKPWGFDAVQHLVQRRYQTRLLLSDNTQTRIPQRFQILNTSVLTITDYRQYLKIANSLGEQAFNRLLQIW